MKKKIIFWILILIWFISIFFYENIDLYKLNNLNKAWISQYWSWNYQISQMIFSWAQLKQADAILEYNKGNSLYKQWENTNNMQDKVDSFQESLVAYSWSLFLEYNKETLENITFIENILEKLSTPEEKNTEKNKEESDNKENNSWDNSDKKSWDEDGSGEESEEKSESESWESKNEKWDKINKEEINENNTEWDSSIDQWDNEKEWQNWEQSSWDEKDEENNKLTEEQKEQIEKYSDQLKKSEFYNQKYFNKKPHEINRDIDDLIRDPFLEDWFVRWWEKDW